MPWNGEKTEILVNRENIEDVFKYLNETKHRVKKLERIRIINIELDVPLGKWRYLSQEEIKFLKNL